MRYLSLERVLAANAALGAVSLSRPGPNIIGFFALKRHGVGTVSPVPVSSAQFTETTQALCGLHTDLHPEHPYFRPLTQTWHPDNYPAGTLYTAWQNSARMTKVGAVEAHLGPGGVWEWRFADHQPRQSTAAAPPGRFYVATLRDHFRDDSRIPLADFVVWLNRTRALDDTVTWDGLVRRFIDGYNLDDDEIDALFVRGDEDLGSSLTDTVLDLTALAAALPPPAKEPQSPSEEALPDVEPEAAQLDNPPAPPVPAPSDDALLANMIAYIRETSRMQVPDDLVRNVLYALRTDRAVMLEGKPGTGKTRFVEAFRAALRNALDGVADVHAVDIAISEETTESDLIGFRDLENEFVPGDLLRGLQVGASDHDVYFVLLDECNLGVLDVYAAKLISAISNDIPIDLPGEGAHAFAPEGSWLPPVGTVLIGTMNSYLEDPSRTQLSIPVKRRFNLIHMPDRMEELLAAGAEGRQQFDDAVRDLLLQVAARLSRRGVSVVDGSILDRLAATPPPDVLDQLWAIGEAVRDKPEIGFTLGVVQSVLAYVLASDFADSHTALDYQVEQKILPLLRGDVGVLDLIEAALKGAYPRTRAALLQMHRVSTDNAGRIRPLA